MRGSLHKQGITHPLQTMSISKKEELIRLYISLLSFSCSCMRKRFCQDRPVVNMLDIFV